MPHGGPPGPPRRITSNACKFQHAPGDLRLRMLLAAALKLASDDIASVPLHRRTRRWAMQKKVHVAMLPDVTNPVAPGRRAVTGPSARRCALRSGAPSGRVA